MDHIKVKEEHATNARIHSTAKILVNPGANKLRSHIAQCCLNPRSPIEIESTLDDSYPPTLVYKMKLFPRLGEQHTQSALSKLNVNYEEPMCLTPENSQRVAKANESRINVLLSTLSSQEREILALRRQLEEAKFEINNLRSKRHMTFDCESFVNREPMELSEDEAIPKFEISTDEDEDSHDDLSEGSETDEAGYESDEY